MSTMPPDAQSLAPALSQAIAALNLDVSPESQSRLLQYLALLSRWNAVYNLTAVRDPKLMLTHHLVDCLAALPAMRRYADGQAIDILDVGSGGGLPGVVMAVCQPDWTVSCVDTVAKKAGFIRQAAAELGLSNLRSLHARVESLDASRHRYQLITSRAFSSLADLVSLTHPLLAQQGVWMAMKGRATDTEEAELPAFANVFHVEQLQVPGMDAQRCLVWMRATES